jgi:peroxiredoxin Q/BCP
MKTLRKAFVTLLGLSSFSLAQALEVGAEAPRITGVSETGAAVDLGKEYAGAYVLVYFYPKADTPGCTAQACSLRDAYEGLLKRHVKIFGVSTDDVAAQKKFKEKYRLPFTLLADTDKKIVQAFGVTTTFGFASRQAFLMKDGRIVWVDHTASTAEQAADVLKYLDQAKP